MSRSSSPLHEQRKRLLALSHWRQQQMNVVWHETNFRWLPREPRFDPLKAFAGDSDRFRTREDWPASSATNGHEVDHWLVQRQPDRNPCQLFAFRKFVHLYFVG